MNFVVAYRAESAPIFLPEEFLRIRVPQQMGDATLTFRTRQIEKGLSSPIPGNLWIDAQGVSNNLEDAIRNFGNAASSITSIIAFSTNAAISDLSFHLAYENTSGLIERKFIQNLLPDEGLGIQKGRRINVHATRELMRSIETHREKERLVRAISQYSLALRNWTYGNEILSTANLYMGMEALTKVFIRKMLESQDENAIALKLGIDTNSLNPCDRLSNLIEAAVRKEILFQGDVDTYKDARKASDGFEHGFLPFDEIGMLAKKVRNKTAKLLREGIINSLDLEPEIKSALLNKPYDEPLGCWPTVKYVRGWLIGESKMLQKEGNEYPILSWSTTIKELELRDSGEYSLRFDQTLTPNLADGIVFRPESFEIWAP